MTKKRKSFWCAGDFCGEVFYGHAIGHQLCPIEDIAQELKGRTLCKVCYGKGQRLELGVVVKMTKPNRLVKLIEAEK